MQIEINNKLKIYFSILFIFCIFFLHIKHQIGNDSTISEWIINYEGGFTKRGLIGQIVIFFSRLSGADLRFTIYLFQILFCLIYFCTIYFLLCNLKHERVSLLALFTPIFFLYPVAEIEVLARKEIIVFSMYLFYLLIPNNSFKIIFFSLFYLLSVLVWEPVIFYTPIFIAKEIIENNIENFNLKFFKFLIAIFPGIIAAIFIAFNPISIENHQIMESVLQNEFNQNCYMSCELLKTKSSILDQFRGNFGSYSFEVFLRYFFIIATGFGPIFLLLYNCELKNKNLLFLRHVSSPLYILLICLVPVIFLFAMGYDWGRWVNISYVFSAIFYFFLLKKNFFVLSSKIQKNFINRIDKKYYIFIFIIFCFGWNPKTVITGDIASFPGYRIPYKTFKFISSDHF